MKDFIFSDVKDQLLNHLNGVGISSYKNKRLVKALKLNNGVVLSVQASESHYCYPKINYGIWSSVEVHVVKGIVSEELLKYNDDVNSDFPVMGYVPIDLVVAVIITSGGI
tara:strand:- start:310 stop:639 length:330 start_codon:yes stop_codon:yes gene_type:complete